MDNVTEECLKSNIYWINEQKKKKVQMIFSLLLYGMQY